MNCHKMGKIIILYLYGELNKKKTLKMNRHLEECSNCRLELKRLRETIKTFQALEVPEPSPSCAEAVRRLAEEKLTVRTSRINIARRLPEIFALRIPRPLSLGLGLLVLLLGLSFYLYQENILFPFNGKMPGKIEEMKNGGNGTVEGGISLDDSISDLQDKVETMNWAMQVSDDSSFNWQVDNLDRTISSLSRGLSGI